MAIVPPAASGFPWNLTLNWNYTGNSTTHNVTVKGFHDPHDHLVYGGPPYVIFFLFACCAMGALIRSILNKVSVNIPYTVVLLIVGVLIGLLSSNVHYVARYTTMVHMDPHLILHVFLPVLIFESAFAMDVHTFMKSSVQICILALFGLMVASVLTAVLAMYVFSYEWEFSTAMMFGSIMSATDPVAVVALLKDLGASKQLGTLIEGESLLNDGCSIVIFEVFKRMSIPGQEMDGLEIFLYFLRVTFCGPLFGYFMARLTTLWLSHIFNDALTEITITLASTYLTFYIGEGILHVSGVLAVVVLGLVISIEKTSISPEVEVFLHRFWEMLAYLANTLIFVLVGVVIVERAWHDVDPIDCFYIITLYIGVNIIRAIAIALFSPILTRVGYGLSWRNASIMTWGGLRGAVGLTLALMVVSTEGIDQERVGSKVLLHTSGIVVLTLVINSTTIGSLLKILGMSNISVPKRQAMANAVRKVQDTQELSIGMLKADRFLADADWDMAVRACAIEDPYHSEDMDIDTTRATSTCPECKTEVQNEPTAKEFADMAEEARQRMMKAQMISYWKQFEHGTLSREAVRVLIGVTETIADNDGEFVDVQHIQKNWEVRGFWPFMKRKLEDWAQNKKDKIPEPNNRVQKAIYTMVCNPIFDYMIYSIIGLNLIPIGLELGIDESHSLYPESEMPLKYINYVLFGIYIMEAILKMIGLRKYYFYSYWNIFDFIIILLSIADTVLDVTYNDSTESFNPNIFKVIKVFKILRAFRGLRLVKIMIPRLINWLNSRINKKLSLGYDVGKGFVVGEEEVSKLIEHMVDNPKILKTLKKQSESSRLAVIKELGLLQRVHPGIAISVKTRQAIRTVLNHSRDTIYELQGAGVLDETEAHKLEKMVEVKMKQLMNAPASIPPPVPELLLSNVAWLQGEPVMLDHIMSKAELIHYDFNEVIVQQGEMPNGVYLIVSGMVKLRGLGNYLAAITSGCASTGSSNTIFEDYLGAGNVIGEMGILTHKPRNVTVSCETSVQAFFISAEDIYAAMAIFKTEPSLENRLWRVCAIRVATPLLMEQSYQNWTQEKVKMHLEKSHLPLLHEMNYVFELDDTMDDVLLIYGTAYNAHTREEFRGPCIIMRTVRKLIFPRNQEQEPRLLVVYNSEHVQPQLDAKVSLLNMDASRMSIHNSSNHSHHVIHKHNRAVVKSEQRPAQAHSEIIDITKHIPPPPGQLSPLSRPYNPDDEKHVVDPHVPTGAEAV
ncbi:sperm-specific sodium:proton exchanger-like [Saccoglossus kowalevskii]